MLFLTPSFSLYIIGNLFLFAFDNGDMLSPKRHVLIALLFIFQILLFLREKLFTVANYIVNSVDKKKLSWNTPNRRSTTVSSEFTPFIDFGKFNFQRSTRWTARTNCVSESIKKTALNFEFRSGLERESKICSIYNLLRSPFLFDFHQDWQVVELYIYYFIKSFTRTWISIEIVRA